MAKSVLEGVRVADWTIAHAGPKGTAWLAALGAEVIHIEQPVVGDHQRFPTTGKGGVTVDIGEGLSGLFENVNLNKKSIILDLSKEKGREVMYRLVAKSDVFATNQLRDTIEKWGMDYETLTKYNSQLIYVCNNMVGYDGPDRLTPGYDTLGQGGSGLMTTSGRREEPPTPVSWGVGDQTSAFAMFSGVLAALIHRMRTGEGQRVDTSQVQALMNIAVNCVLGIYGLMSEEQRKANPYGGVVRAYSRDKETATGNYFRSKDGKWVQITAATDKYFVNLVKIMGYPELAEDPRFADRDKRAENNRELIKILDKAFAQHTSAEWREKFRGRDIPFYPINDLPDLLEDPQILANDMLWQFYHPKLKRQVTLPGMPFSLSKTPGRVTSPAPEFGEHTEEVLLELGYSWDEIAQLQREGVF